jgi:hypothetical protein
MLGVVFPGEVAILVAGAAAQLGTLSLWAVIPTSVAGAVIGDAVGFGVGRRNSERLLRRLPDRLPTPPAVRATTELLRRRRPIIVLIGGIPRRRGPGGGAGAAGDDQQHCARRPGRGGAGAVVALPCLAAAIETGEQRVDLESDEPPVNRCATNG